MAALDIADTLINNEWEIGHVGTGTGDEELIPLEDEPAPAQVQFWQAGQRDVDGNVQEVAVAQFSVLYGDKLINVQVTEG